MNEQTIRLIAEAVISSNKVLMTLVESLSHDDKAKVAEVVTQAVPTPEPTPAPASVQQVAAPAPVPVPAAPAPAPAMPAPPVFEAPAPTPAAPAPAPSNVQQMTAPFSDGNGLTKYVLESYKAMGPSKGPAIQELMTKLGYTNINDVRPEHYNALYQGVEALKVS